MDAQKYMLHCLELAQKASDEDEVPIGAAVVDPESGEIVFAYDVSQEDAAFDFWFITVRIALNDAGEIAYMEYEYVPWG